jgi:hypothetical protein
MAMRMLEAGGLGIVTDGVRVPDENNPRGYYEYERVKTLDSDPDKSWLVGARGKAIKIVSFLLRDLPETNNYHVIFMHRNIDEVMASQRKMLNALGAPPDSTTDERIAAGYRDHLVTVRNLLRRRTCFEVLELEYADVLDRPVEHAGRINRFLRLGLDAHRMAAVVDRALYRSQL